ncbi:MAG TPA: STAS domain-containing protein [Actinocrinis sp.]|nr:STAS domain-containing protein [Actinocrinis sp.]
MTVPLTFALLPATDGTATLRVRGEVDLTCADKLRETATTALARHTSLTLDLSGAYFFDAAAVRALRAVHREAARLHKPTPALRGVRPQLARMLRLTGTDRLYPVETAVPLAAPSTVDMTQGLYSHHDPARATPGCFAE